MIAATSRLHSICLRLLLCLCLLSAAPSARADDLGQVLAAIEKAYGPPPSFMALRQTGRTFSDMRGEGPMERLWAAPDRFRIRLDYPAGSEVRTMSGERAWQGRSRKDGPFLLAMRLQAARALLPWNLLKSGRVTLLGSRTDDRGQRVQTLVLMLDSPLSLVVDVDPASGRILRSTGLGIGSLQFVTEYSEFRQLGERLAAIREDHYAMGRHIGHSILQRIDFLPDPGPAAFTPDSEQR